MSDLIAIAYRDRPTVERVRARLDDAIKARLAEVDGVVIVTSDEQGKVKLGFMRRLGGTLARG